VTKMGMSIPAGCAVSLQGPSSTMATTPRLMHSVPHSSPITARVEFCVLMTSTSPCSAFNTPANGAKQSLNVVTVRAGPANGCTSPPPRCRTGRNEVSITRNPSLSASATAAVLHANNRLTMVAVGVKIAGSLLAGILLFKRVYAAPVPTTAAVTVAALRTQPQAIILSTGVFGTT